jgi:putative ABC transport system ATP-binding protein
MTPGITLRDVSKVYPGAAGDFTALADVNLTVDRGDFAVVVGQSGSGKSTLLGLLAGIDRPTRGEIIVGEVPVHTLSERALSAWRGRAVGLVFQFFQLLPTLTACENVMLPMDFCGMWPVRERQALSRCSTGSGRRPGRQLPTAVGWTLTARVSPAR